jgi:hypothetical protein
MSVPSIRFSKAQVREFAARLRACARDASLALGWRGTVSDTSPTMHRRPA